MKVIQNGGRKGFTLVEFLFVAFTMALFMTALFRITQGGLRAYQRGVVQTEMKHELRNIMDRITTDIRQAQPGTFASPSREYSITGFQPTLDFRRCKYSADNTVPDATIRVVYSAAFGGDVINTKDGNGYYMTKITRAETISGTTVTTTLSENVSTSWLDRVHSMSVLTGGFRWSEDPLNNMQANIDVLNVAFALVKTHSGSNEPEIIKTSSMIALRTGKDLAAGSNYYPPTAVTDPYANLQRFGNPTSLVKP